MHTSNVARQAARESVLSHFDKRWLGVPLAAAGVAMVADQAQAAVVTFNGPVTIPVTATGVFINLETGASGSLAAAGGATQPLGNFWGTGSNRLWFYPTSSTVNKAVGATGNLTPLPGGAVVGPASTYAANATAGSPMSPANTNFTSTAGFTGNVGFQFQNIAGTTTYYGYANVTYNAWTGGTAPGGGTINFWSFEDTGAPITVVPEPASLAGLALGAVGLLARRTKKVA